MTWLRRVPLTVYAWLAVVLPLVVGTIYHWHHIPYKPDGTVLGIADPDPWLRLMLVRDWLQGGSWYSHVVARTNAPFGGISSPWTRPLDVVIALLVKIQSPGIDINTRLIHAALIMPVLWAGFMMAGIFRLARALCPLPLTPVACAALALTAFSMWGYFAAGYADHHTPLATLFVWALGGLLQRQPSQRTLAFSGALLGLMLWMSPEALVLIAAIYAWYGCRWLMGFMIAAVQLLPVTLGAAVITFAAVMIERPATEWLVPVYDSISVVYAYILGACALLAWLISIFRHAEQPIRYGIAFAGGAAVLAGLHMLYPLAFHGPMATADPYIFKHFLPRINEARPLKVRNSAYVVAQLAQPLLALGISLMAVRGDSLYPRSTGMQLFFFLALTFCLYCTEQRWYYYLYPLTLAVIAGWMAALLDPDQPLLKGRLPARWLQGLSEKEQAKIRLPVLLAIVSIPGLLLISAPSGGNPHSDLVNACQSEARRWIHGGELNEIGGGKPLNLFIWTDLGAEILFWTPHRIVASNYHREGPGIQYVWEADGQVDPNGLYHYLRERKIDAVLECPGSSETKGSVLQRLQSGKLSLPWMVPVPITSDEPKESRPGLFLVRPTLVPGQLGKAAPEQ